MKSKEMNIRTIIEDAALMATNISTTASNADGHSIRFVHKYKN